MTARPEWSTVTTWDRLDKIAIDYRRLLNRLSNEAAHVVDRKFIERTALQLEATRNQVSEGSIEHTTAIAVLQAAEAMFPLARDLVRARKATT
jgi:hypothetical protein